MTTPWQPTPEDNPFQRLGGGDAVRALTEEFYEEMFRTEPALTKVHRLADDGRVHPEMRARFTLFLIGWLGGPKDYVAQFGHPRLRMRHIHVPIGTELRDAWMRCMVKAMEVRQVPPEVRAYLQERLFEVADFMRNLPEATPAAPRP